MTRFHNNLLAIAEKEVFTMRFFLAAVLAFLAVEECSAWIPSSPSFINRLSSLHSTTEEETGSSTSSRADLPDYGKTSVEVDKIRLTKAKAKWRRKDLFGNSLIDQTVKELKEDVDFQETAARYAELGAETVTREERAVRRRALDEIGIPSFDEFVADKIPAKIQRREPKGKSKLELMSE
jgi:hypothetical protein